jgi:hypothetical protein
MSILVLKRPEGARRLYGLWIQLFPGRIIVLCRSLVV